MMLELAAQVGAGEMPRPDVLVVATGSSGTLAALALGAAYLGWPTEVVGGRIAPRIVTNRVTIGAVVRGTRKLLVERAGVPAARLANLRWRVVHGAIGGGYGHPTPEAIDAVERWRELTGVAGEVTYSGKALVGLRALARDPAYHGQTILLLNTLSVVRPPVVPDAQARLPERFAGLLRGEVVI
jgi:D-cysteine desulfhydrase